MTTKRKRKPIPRPGRVTTGSKSTPIVSFRVSADEHKAASKAAKRRGLTIGQLAHAALEIELGRLAPW